MIPLSVSRDVHGQMDSRQLYHSVVEIKSSFHNSQSDKWRNYVIIFIHF